MENESNQKSPISKTLPIAIVAVVIVVALIAVFLTNQNSKKEQTTLGESTVPQPTEAVATKAPIVADSQSYEDGVYEAEGDYVSPGGDESIDVKITLNGGVVTDADVVSNATRPTSKQMQSSFIGGYKEQVIGKKIDEIKLSKVAMSSLTPKGFNNALEKIKSQAKGS